MSSQRAGQLGISKVETTVLELWKSRWQQIDAQNDDGIDGLIFVERNNRPTGQIIFAQVKRQAADIVDGRYAVTINREQLERNLDRWRRLAGAAILIHVDPETGVQRWANVRQASAIGPTRVYVPIENLFDEGAKDAIARLAGNLHADLMMPQPGAALSLNVGPPSLTFRRSALRVERPASAKQPPQRRFRPAGDCV